MDWITDFIGDMFGTAAQVLIEDWWRDPKKKWLAIGLLFTVIVLIIVAIMYALS